MNNCTFKSENYTYVFNTLKKSTSVFQASNVVLLSYEKPADQSEAVQNKRASRGQVYYDKYHSSSSSSTSASTPTKPSSSGGVKNESEKVVLKYKVGDIVNFAGTKHYISSNSPTFKECKSGVAKVTEIAKNAKHPYHLIAEKGKGSTVYGWVNESDISGKVSTTNTSSNGNNVKVEYAKSLDKTLSGTYKTTENLNMRAGAGTSKAILTVIPKGDKVSCYGYYTAVNNAKWYYVTYKNNNGVKFTGFVSSKYLKK